MNPITLGVEVAMAAVAAGLTIPVLIVAIECVASALGAVKRVSYAPRTGRVGILIPAHNEETVLPRTLTMLMPQLREGDVCLVIADNCTDQTASAAIALGAKVVQRNDDSRRGKGWALDFGMRSLRER
ncbi:MAG: glycosyltransferase, partial [Planctomycetota bacterium]|nr:glycosyltransferase [Planctomycetota bacterium]